MSTSFISHTVQLKTLFDPRFSFTIPIYQRPFSWTDEQSTRLFDDIVKAMGNNGEVKSGKSFFLGALILTGNMDRAAKEPLAGRLIHAFNAVVSGEPDLPENITGNFDVVDGKQRLVTLKILLCLLRDLSPNEDTELDRIIGNGQNGNCYRLKLCGGENDFLRNHILPKGSSVIPITDLEDLSVGEKRMILVRNGLHDGLLNLSSQERQSMLEYIINHCEVVIILSEEFDQAYKIFLSMNDTGKDLTEGDILKAELMSCIDQQDMDKYQQIWGQWNDALGEARSAASSQKKTFFNHFRNVLTSDRTNLLNDFHIAVEKAQSSGSFINDKLIPNINAYETIYSSNWPQQQNKREMDRILGTLRWLPHDDWIAPAMLAITRYADDPDNMLAFFQKFERLAYGLLIIPTGYDDRKKKYNPLNRSLRGEAGKKDPFVMVEYSANEKKTIQRIIEHGLHKNRPAAARLLLLRLDMEETGNSVAHYNVLMEEEGFSVEHLLPLNPNANSRWTIDFADKKDRSQNMEMLGNLFLVRENSENPEMGNRDFISKYEILFANKPDHPIHLTNQLRSLNQWTPALLAARQEKLLAIIDTFWGH